MTDQKHTPGPWHVTGNYVICADSIKLGKPYRHDVPVASMFDDPLTRQQMDANARLIAAAPDLLAALEHLDNATNEPSLGIDLVEASDKARAAIAKAKP